MKSSVRAGLVTIGFLLACVAVSCSSDNPPQPSQMSPQEAAVKNGFTSILMEHGKGFLAEQPELPDPKKRLLYLEGTHYQMGYQTGYLCPVEVKMMTHDFLDDFLFDMFQLPFRHNDLGFLWRIVRAYLIRLSNTTDHAIPQALREEMQGIADGYEQARLEGRAPQEVTVDYADVLLLNQGIDILSAIEYSLLGKGLGACNQFVAWGTHTDDGRLLHGRDYQFYTAGVFQNMSLVSIHRPLREDGSPAGLPFISPSAPGLVGQMTGMNSRGISMGVDVVYSWAARNQEFGLSSLMVLRSVVENASTIEEAIEIVRKADRACPWIFMISDAKALRAVELETIQSQEPIPRWMEKRRRQAERLGARLIGEPFACPYPAEGISIRGSDYVLPEIYRNKGIVIPWWINDRKYPDDHTFLNYNFADPIEELPELIAVTNHFFLPEMRPFEWAFLFSFVIRDFWPDTQWRYKSMMDILLAGSTGGNRLDWESAWNTIDYLKPGTPEGDFYWGSALGQEVHGHVALMDGKNLIMRARFGYYYDPWIDVAFKDFCRQSDL